MQILNQDQIEKIKTDNKYRRELFYQKLNTLKILISKFSLSPLGKLHPGLLRNICETDYVINLIREIDYKDKNIITNLGTDWEPFMGWSFFEGFIKLPQPVSDLEIQYLMKSFPNLTRDIYKKVGIDISETENEQDLDKVKSPDQQKDENIFINNGATWTIKFIGKEKTIKHTLGMIYLAYLLKHQGNEFSAIDLKCTLVSDSVLVKKTIDQKKAIKQKENLSNVPERMPLISQNDLNRLNDILKKKKKELNKAMMEQDKSVENKLSDEIEKIELYIRSFTDKYGKIRIIPDEYEKARKSVWAVINTAKNNIRVPHKELFYHLDEYIHTGGRLTYTPKKFVRWIVKI